MGLRVAFAAAVAWAVPRESPDFDPELHVADMSESEAVPQEDRREAERGCHWTARLSVELCVSGRCEPAEILAFDFQRRAWAFYENGTAAAPLEEAIWVTAMPSEELISAFDLCPGLIVTALLMAAEAEFPVQAAKATQHLQLAKHLMGSLRSSPLEFGALLAMWPVERARARAEHWRTVAAGRIGSVDVVVARCATSLRWMRTLPLMLGARVLVYEKCPRPPGEVARQLEDVSDRVAVLAIPLYDEGAWMTGECGAYLQHLLRGIAGEEPVKRLADFTIFIHDDAPRHLKPAFLGLVLQAMGAGNYRIPFLNLAHERYVETRTPCLERLYELVFGQPLLGRLSTYCCGHFVVSAERASSVPTSRFRRLLAAVESGEFAALAGGPCEVANMPCYVVEFLWHALFDEPDVAPWRSEDKRLPLFLRYEGGRATRLPSPLGVEPYMHMQPHYAPV